LPSPWRAAERHRQAARELYLEELSAAADLLRHLGARVGLGADVAFLLLDELPGLGDERRLEGLRAIALGRKETWQHDRDILLPSELSLRDLEDVTSGSAGEAAEAPAPAVETDAAMRGSWVAGPCQALSGVARVFRDGAAPPEIKAGEILVAHHLEPRWLPGLRRAAAWVTETGGMLSHVAILARELGTPSIVGVRDATRRLKTGDHLRLTSDGAVVVLDEGSETWMSMAVAARASGAGRKANRMAVMQQDGLSVPAAAVLTYQSLRAACRHWACAPPRYGESNDLPAGLRTRDLPDQVRCTVRELMAALGPCESGLIVRSSALVEDAAGHSLAGLLHSERCSADEAQVVEAVCHCWEAAWSEAMTFRDDASLRGSPVGLSLIVQHFVSGSPGGVMFTVDPMRKEGSAIVIEASAGGPEHITAGRTPDLRIHLSRDDGSEDGVGATELLTAERQQELARTGRQLERLFGAPQDIEWVFAEGRLWVLQSRDVGGA
jgi:phosphoenolpyruvate synthase/pyruvate phosphate dikinase